MDIVKVAQQAGMTVVLEAKIGRHEYQSVHGPVASLERFAELIEASLEAEREACVEES